MEQFIEEVIGAVAGLFAITITLLIGLWIVIRLILSISRMIGKIGK